MKRKIYKKRPAIQKATRHIKQTISFQQDDTQRVLKEYSIPLQFPKSVLKELHQIPDVVEEQDFKHRKDLRDKNFVTIDGPTAKDFDDSVYVEQNKLGYQLFIAIADVSHYVKEGSLLDQEAYLRGNSTYLADVCIPMLPEKLSTHLCSLNPLQDRLVMVAEIHYDFQAHIRHFQIYPAVIKSKKRLTYEDIQNHIDNQCKDLKFVKPLQNLAQILINKHYQQGGLNLDILDTYVVCNELGEPIDIVKQKRLFAHQMIEHFMLEANKIVSTFLEQQQIPLIYRIHENPKIDKLQQLEIFVKTLGYGEFKESRKSLIRLLEKFKDHQKAPMLNKLVLRTLSQARYSAYNKGHYGLNFKSYTHFTSPIRRYCDLMVHRLLKVALNKQKYTLTPKMIEEKASFISAKEQNSVKAERQLMDIQKTRFLSYHLGNHFSGVISSVTSFGLFVSLDSMDIEGLIRFADLAEHWIVDETHLRVTAKRSRYSMQFGDEVEIQVIATNPLLGNIDFELITHKGRPLPKPKRLNRKTKSQNRDKLSLKTQASSHNPLQHKTRRTSQDQLQIENKSRKKSHSSFKTNKKKSHSKTKLKYKKRYFLKSKSSQKNKF